MIARRWQLAQPGADSNAKLAVDLGVPPLFSACLLNRGCATAEDATTFLEPRLASLTDPFLLPDMGLAVDRLIQAREAKERFAIFGDYDVDGVTATAILAEFFQELGWECCHYLPHRMDEGYGLSREGVENCLKRHEVKLLVAVDCGSSAAEIIGELKGRGIDVIVLDHHQVSSPAPPALALVNPQLLDASVCPEHLKNLCSAGVAFKLAHALLKRGRTLDWAKAHAFDLRESLDLVALGTIADMVPLQGENRIFARIGLEKLGCSKRMGLHALKSVAGVGDTVSCQDVGFQLGPRLNAAGRLETALDALELLLTKDASRADTLAKTLNEQNRIRRSIEQKITDEVLAAVRARFNPATDYAIVEGHPNWHLGVVGIVASRVLREFHRPVLILGGGGAEEWRGSGRSIEGFDFAAGLRKCEDLLVKHGGHAMAAGVTVAASKVSELRQRFNSLVRESLSPEALRPILRIDAEVCLSDLTLDTLRELQRLAPFGQANPPVHFAARGIRVRGEPRRMGNARQHLRFNASDGQQSHPAVWWNCDQTELPAVFDLAFAPELSEYNGNVGIQLKVLDLRPASP